MYCNPNPQDTASSDLALSLGTPAKKKKPDEEQQYPIPTASAYATTAEFADESKLYPEWHVQQPRSCRGSYMLAQLLGVCAVIMVVAYCSSQHTDNPVPL